MPPGLIRQVGTALRVTERALPNANPAQFTSAYSPQEVDRAGWIQLSIANVPGKVNTLGRKVALCG